MASESFYDEPDILGIERKIVLGRAISALIRKQRKVYQESLTQEELAFRSGISYEHLNRIENSKAMASVEVLDRIARALGFHRLSDFFACDESKIL
jgi:transcriptional regulator with XRE-family HTH domain